MIKYADLNDKEKSKVILMLADFMIENKSSTRKTAQYAEEQGIKISHISLYNCFLKILPKINKEKFQKIEVILNGNKPKTVENDEVELRVYKAAALLRDGYNIPEIAQKLDSTYDTIYDDLTSRYPKLNPEKAEELKKILTAIKLGNLKNNPGGGVPTSKHKPTLQLSDSEIEIIILTALTYRVSFKNLEKLLKIPEDEIRKMFKKFNDYNYAIYYLDLETRNEEFIYEQAAYIKAFNFLKKRKRLNKEIQIARVNKDNEAVESLIKQLKEHLTIIDDTIVLNTIGKQFSRLDEKEREKIARFRLKYGMPIKRTCQMLKRERETIYALENELAEADSIFKERIEILNDRLKEKNYQFLDELRKNK